MVERLNALTISALASWRRGEIQWNRGPADSGPSSEGGNGVIGFILKVPCTSTDELCPNPRETVKQFLNPDEGERVEWLFAVTINIPAAKKPLPSHSWGMTY